MVFNVYKFPFFIFFIILHIFRFIICRFICEDVSGIQDSLLRYFVPGSGSHGQWDLPSVSFSFELQSEPYRHDSEAQTFSTFKAGLSMNILHLSATTLLR